MGMEDKGYRKEGNYEKIQVQCKNTRTSFLLHPDKMTFPIQSVESLTSKQPNDICFKLRKRAKVKDQARLWCPSNK